MDAGVPGDVSGLATLLRDRRELFLRIHELNLLPSRGLGAGWAEMLLPPAAAALAARDDLDARAHRWLSALLLRSPALEGLPARWTPTPALALALPGPADLLELARRIGVSLASGTLRGLLAAGPAAAVRRSLGDALYAFALERAPLLVTGAELEAAAGTGGEVAPEAFGDTVERLGAGALRAAWEAEGLWRRARLKLPRALAEAVEQAPALQPAAATRLAVRVARESDSRWSTSFAPASA